jgi:hypothetical protein
MSLKLAPFGDGDRRREVVAVAVLVADVLDEQHEQDVVLVLAGIHAAAQFIAGGPEGGVEVGFLDGHDDGRSQGVRGAADGQHVKEPGHRVTDGLVVAEHRLVQRQALHAESGGELRGGAVQCGDRRRMQDGLAVAVEMLAHGNHPVVGELRRGRGAARFPGLDEAVNRLRFGLLQAHAREEGGHRRQSAQAQEGCAERLGAGTAGRVGAARIDQLLDAGRQVLGREERMADDFLQFLDLDLDEIGCAGAGGGDEIMRAAVEAGGAQAPFGIVVAERTHVVVVRGELVLGPGLEVVREMRVIGIHDATEAIPAAAREDFAEGEFGRQRRELPGHHRRSGGGRNSYAQLGDPLRQLLPV